MARFADATVVLSTATASPKEQSVMIKKLGLTSPVSITMNPDRTNIVYYKELRPPSSETIDHLDTILQPMVEDLLNHKITFPLTILYSDTPVIGYCFWFFDKKMGKEQYLPVHEPVPENRLFAQFHATYTDVMNAFIIKELCEEHSKIRIVFATMALGMGLNAKHVRRVLHYKPPTTLSRYFQETGRAGRDAQPATALLYYNNTDIRSNRPGINRDIISYCKNNDSCYRHVMLERFGYKKSTTLNHCCGFCNPI